eukprot:6186533-Pleurochrysis_carterae.AAC.3
MVADGLCGGARPIASIRTRWTRVLSGVENHGFHRGSAVINHALQLREHALARSLSHGVNDDQLGAGVFVGDGRSRASTRGEDDDARGVRRECEIAAELGGRQRRVLGKRRDVEEQHVRRLRKSCSGYKSGGREVALESGRASELRHACPWAGWTVEW